MLRLQQGNQSWRNDFWWLKENWKICHHRPQLMELSVHACNLKTRNDRPTLFFRRCRHSIAKFSYYPSLAHEEEKKEKKTESTFVHIHFSSFLGLGTITRVHSINNVCLNTHFSKSIIGSCAWCGSMKGRLSIGSKIGWCWNGFIHWLIITRLNTSRNPSRDATLSISGPIEHSIHYEIARNCFTKRNSGSLITPQNEATFFCCCFEFLLIFFAAIKWLTLENLDELSKWGWSVSSWGSKLKWNANDGPNYKLCDALNFMNLYSWQVNLVQLWFRTYRGGSMWPEEWKIWFGEKMWRGGRELAGSSWTYSHQNAWKACSWELDVGRVFWCQPIKDPRDL